MPLEALTYRRPGRRPDLPDGPATSALPMLLVGVVTIASLYFGRDVFVPLALAVLLSFALAPVVRWMRRMGLPNLPAVLLSVTLAFTVILTFLWVVTLQVAELAERLPRYQTNIERKIEGLLETPPGGRFYARTAEMMRDLGRKIEQVEEDQEQAEEAASPTASPATTDEDAVAVVIQQPEQTSWQALQSILGPLIGPLATAGIVVVFVIFMLLKRDDLRDRVIRLVGSRDLPRTTQALNDAASRVGRYLLMQLAVNATYGIPIGIGLWLIGLPNPILWGMLCTVLRFVPYIGPIIAAFFPLALAVAIDPGWNTLLWAGALFVLIELISNNVVEPLLYGSSTGLSPIAVITAAVFWTWLWGPVGLLLSTPLTVCLVVLGQHVPHLGFLSVLLGSEPVLSPPEHLYQRLLVGDAVEATERAEEYLNTHTLTGFHDEVLIPALILAEYDRDRGALGGEQLAAVADSATTLLDNLAEWEPTARSESDEADTGVVAEPLAAALAGVDRRLVLCAGARNPLDEAAAMALAQVAERCGVDARVLSSDVLQSARLRELDLDQPAVVVLSYLSSQSLAHARFLVRRLRRRLPGAKIVIGFWGFPREQNSRRDPVDATHADAVAATIHDAIEQLIAELSPNAVRAPVEGTPVRLAAVSDR